MVIVNGTNVCGIVLILISENACKKLKRIGRIVGEIMKMQNVSRLYHTGMAARGRIAFINRKNGTGRGPENITHLHTNREGSLLRHHTAINNGRSLSRVSVVTLCLNHRVGKGRVTYDLNREIRNNYTCYYGQNVVNNT